MLPSRPMDTRIAGAARLGLVSPKTDVPLVLRVVDRLRLVYLQFAALSAARPRPEWLRCPVTSIRGAVETGRLSGNPSSLLSILFCSKLAQPLNRLFFAAEAGDRTVPARTAHLIYPVLMATRDDSEVDHSDPTHNPMWRHASAILAPSSGIILSSYSKALSAQLKSQLLHRKIVLLPLALRPSAEKQD